MKLERLAISCGGTGGHFYPGLAVARKFKENGGNVLLLIGGKNAPAQSRIADSYGIENIQIPASPPSLRPMGFLRFFRNFLTGKKMVKKAFLQHKTQALLCMGSFASLPPAFAAKSLAIPLFLHDGNARLGKANKFLSRYAKALALSFPSPDAAKCHCPAIFTGMPLRKELKENISLSKEKAIDFINEKYGSAFTHTDPILLAFGGSLGAASLNKAVLQLLTLPGAEKLQFIHLAGKGKVQALEEAYASFKGKKLLLESSDVMHFLYPAADLIICRAGGSTVAESACFGKYTFLVPYPFAAEDHQFDNASFLAESGGASILRDDAFLVEKLKKNVSLFLASPGIFMENGRKNLAKGKPEADEEIISLMENILFSAQNPGKKEE